MLGKVYLGDAFGWDFESKSKVAISGLRSRKVISLDERPKKQLSNDTASRLKLNAFKIIGYVPVLNILLGVYAFATAKNSKTGHPENQYFWRFRAITMVLTGPLLLPIDLLKSLYDKQVVDEYNEKNPKLIKEFDAKSVKSKK